MSILTILVRLLLAAFFGGLVGMEREKKRRAAGFRTHILVSMGSALVMITSQYMFIQYEGLTNFDPSRLGAQVISGIGFLGAGTIIRQGESVKGLTTAASLWGVSCIGIAVGTGFYEAASIATLIVFITLILLGKMEQFMKKTQSNFEVGLRIENIPGKLGEVTTIFGQMSVNITNIKFIHEDADGIDVNVFAELPKDLKKERFNEILKNLDGVSIIS